MKKRKNIILFTHIKCFCTTTTKSCWKKFSKTWIKINLKPFFYTTTTNTQKKWTHTQRNAKRTPPPPVMLITQAMGMICVKSECVYAMHCIKKLSNAKVAMMWPCFAFAFTHASNFWFKIFWTKFYALFWCNALLNAFVMVTLAFAFTHA